MTTMTQKPAKRASIPKPLAVSGSGTFLPPPPVGSSEEALATAKAIGWPGAFGLCCQDVEQVIRHRLLWHSE